MLTAKKGNKVIRVDNSTKQRYLNDGFTIYDDGKVVARGRGTSVSLPEYLALVEENERLKAEIAELKAKKTKAKKN